MKAACELDLYALKLSEGRDGDARAMDSEILKYELFLGGGGIGTDNTVGCEAGLN